MSKIAQAKYSKGTKHSKLLAEQPAIQHSIAWFNGLVWLGIPQSWGFHWWHVCGMTRCAGRYLARPKSTPLLPAQKNKLRMPGVSAGLLHGLSASVCEESWTCQKREREREMIIFGLQEYYFWMKNVIVRNKSMTSICGIDSRSEGSAQFVQRLSSYRLRECFWQASFITNNGEQWLIQCTCDHC